MDTVTPGTSRNIFKKKKTIKIIAICLTITLLAAGVYVFIQAKNSKSNGTVAQRTAKVVKGELIDSINGSAPIQSSNRSELSPKVTATLEQVNCKEGDQVKAGDVLFVLDNTDAMLNIENAENGIAQMQLTMDSTAKSVNGLVVKAPYSGQITNVSVKLGDSVNKGGAILTITDVSKLNVTLPFSGAAVRNVSVGQKATVYLQDLMLSVDGIVTYKSSSPYTTASGGELYNIEITVDNPGSLKEGMKATAEMMADGVLLDSVDSGMLAYVNSKVLKSDAGGTVTGLNVRDNEFVNASDILLKLENDDLLLTSSSNDIKMENLLSQLEIQKKQLSYYNIEAPYDGTITSLGTANEGDTVKQGEVLAVVSDMSHLEFAISIDELDISQIAVGQVVKITADAIEETATTPLTGKVSKVAMEGTSSNGVTTYPVTVMVDDDAASKLKTGMNIDAEIMISDKSNVLMVPLEAVITMGNKSFVYVKGISNQSSQSRSTNRKNSNRTSGRSNTSGAASSSDAGSASSSGAAGSGSGAQDTPPQGDFPQGTPPQGTDAQSQQAGEQGRQTNSTSSSAVKGGFTRAAQRANSDTYYAGASMVEVETGISNDTYIEIVSGLTEGQEIVLPKVSASTSSGSGSSNQRNQGGIMGGGMIGGARGF